MAANSRGWNKRKVERNGRKVLGDSEFGVIPSALIRSVFIEATLVVACGCSPVYD
jgi:hypothetical protein